MEAFDLLSPGTLVWIAIATLAAGFVHGALGFGYPLVAMPLLGIVLDAKATILIVILPAFVLSVTNAIVGGRWAESIGRYWYLPLAIMTGAYIGTRSLITADPAPILLLLAVALLLYLNMNRIGPARFGWTKQHPVIATIAFGVVGGWMESSTNMNLPVLMVLFGALELGPRVIVQLLNYSGVGGKSAQILGWSAAEGIGVAFWVTMLPWVAFSALGLAIGYRVRSRIEPATYMRWFRGFLWLMSVALLARFGYLVLGAV